MVVKVILLIKWMCVRCFILRLRDCLTTATSVWSLVIMAGRQNEPLMATRGSCCSLKLRELSPSSLLKQLQPQPRSNTRGCCNMLTPFEKRQQWKWNNIQCNITTKTLLRCSFYCKLNRIYFIRWMLCSLHPQLLCYCPPSSTYLFLK